MSTRQQRRLLTAVWLIIASVYTLQARGEATSSYVAVPPSPEFLELLADFEAMDDVTFEWILHHGLQGAELDALANEVNERALGADTAEGGRFEDTSGQEPREH